MQIRIKVVPYAKMKNQPNVGDWRFDRDGSLDITVADTGDKYSSFLVAVHELVEAMLCKKDGVQESDVTEFDEAHKDCDEPGEHIDSPYREQHAGAIEIEKDLCEMLGMLWTDHEARLAKISP